MLNGRLQVLAAATLLAGCAGTFPSSGPSASSIHDARENGKGSGVEIVNLDEAVVRRLGAARPAQSFSERFRGARPVTTVGPGDSLEVSILEAPPASLFAGAQASVGKGDSATAGAVTLPEQMIDSSGTITIPFAGQVYVAGHTLRQIEEEIARRLRKQANQPQVVVRLSGNNTAYATVMGEVAASSRVPLTPRREKILDAIATAGGAAAPVERLTVQVTRGENCLTVPLQTVIRDPQQNIVLQAGDVITVLYQPYSFTALGATGKNEEIYFEGEGINLAQALARAGGLNDARANARGVFIFRFESAMNSPHRPVYRTAEAKVPVVYSLDLSAPQGLFLAKAFPVKDGDVIYVANAPAVELQKFIGIIGSIASPGLGAAATSANVSNQ